MSLTITGLIWTILSIVFTTEEANTLMAFFDQALLVAGILLTYWGRYRMGDINWYGARKE